MLVKDNESLKTIESQLSEKLKKHKIKCLTIEQAKGLEFEDVIIWDFFS